MCLQSQEHQPWQLVPGQAAVVADALAAQRARIGATRRRPGPLPPVEIRRDDLPPVRSTEARRESPVGVDMMNQGVRVRDVPGVGEVLVKSPVRPGGVDRGTVLTAAAGRISGVEVPETLGWVTGQDGSVVAVATVWVPEAVDGWTWAVDSVVAHLRGGDEPDWPHRLGAVAARMHHGLTEQLSPRGGWGAQEGAAAVNALQRRFDRGADMESALRESDQVTRRIVGRRLAAVDHARSSVRALTGLEWSGPPAEPLAILHGDLHVGQVLRSPASPGNLFLTDFDGDPLDAASPGDLSTDGGPSPGLAVEDLAHLAASVWMCAPVAGRRLRVAGIRWDASLREKAKNWGDRAAADLIRSYAEQSRLCQRRLPDPELTTALMRLQLVRELRYAAEHLPPWQYAGAGALELFVPADRHHHEEHLWTPPPS